MGGRLKVNGLAIILLFVSFLFLFTGISMAIFNYFGTGKTSNVIQTGKVVFSYSDAAGGSNGINITDAYPIEDSLGKLLSNSNEYFDFSVSASTVNTTLAYEIVAIKQDNSTLDENQVKIYLTEFNGSQEVETPITNPNNSVLTYGELKDTDNNLLTGKTIYYGIVDEGEVAYGKRFRLRMWVKLQETEDEYLDITDKTFSVKVNVAATSVH